MSDDVSRFDEAHDEEVVGSELAIIRHPLDTADPVPVRTRQELVKEALLLLPNVVKLLYRLSRDSRVPRRRRIVMGLITAYLVSPIDLILDAIPVVGGVDDLLLMAFAVDYLLKASPEELVDEYWDGSEDGLDVVRGLAAWGVEMLPDRIKRIVARG